jgi:hypothetical protein
MKYWMPEGEQRPERDTSRRAARVSVGVVTVVGAARPGVDDAVHGEVFFVLGVDAATFCNRSSPSCRRRCTSVRQVSGERQADGPGENGLGVEQSDVVAFGDSLNDHLTPGLGRPWGNADAATNGGHQRQRRGRVRRGAPGGCIAPRALVALGQSRTRRRPHESQCTTSSRPSARMRAISTAGN